MKAPTVEELLLRIGAIFLFPRAMKLECREGDGVRVRGEWAVGGGGFITNPTPTIVRVMVCA